MNHFVFFKALTISVNIFKEYRGGPILFDAVSPKNSLSQNRTETCRGGLLSV